MNNLKYLISFQYPLSATDERIVGVFQTIIWIADHANKPLNRFYTTRWKNRKPTVIQVYHYPYDP